MMPVGNLLKHVAKLACSFFGWASSAGEPSHHNVWRLEKAMESTPQDTRRRALERYLQVGEALQMPAPLGGPPFPYDTCPLIHQVAWRVPAIAVDPLIEGELRELTNTLNAWRAALRRWHTWIAVLDEFTAEDAWGLQWEFVESIAFQCLFYPSATRDRFIFVATNALHQVRMTMDERYPDRLPSDPRPGHEHKGRPPSRKKGEAQLESIVSVLDGGADFMAALQSLDEERYRTLTSNFRNLASHAIAPRLTVGQTAITVRQVVPATTHVQQPNGTFEMEVVQGQQQVSYGVGGTEPLQMRDLLQANLAEFRRGSACFDAYIHVLNTAMATLPRC